MNKGVLFGIGAFTWWGLFPIFFKLLEDVPPLEIMAHRIVWSTLLLLALVLFLGQFRAILHTITPRVLLIYLAAAFLVAINWYLFVYSVISDRILEGSLGYFINPFVSVLLGVVFLRERLRPLQWLPIGIAAAGVAYLAFNYGQVPWISLTLAFSFGLYGLVKKLAPLSSLHGLTLETSLITLPAIGYIVYLAMNGTASFGDGAGLTNLYLLLGGVVTVVPLLLFSASTRLIPLSTVGVLQYIGPTGQFLCGVLLFGEEFTPVRVVAFVAIWVALLIYTGEGFFHRGRVASSSMGLKREAKQLEGEDRLDRSIQVSEPEKGM